MPPVPKLVIRSVPQRILSSCCRRPSPSSRSFSIVPQGLLSLLGRRWEPLDFSEQSFPRISSDYLVEEENLPDYVASRYYPTRIGEVLQDRYQVVGKLGYGVSSTVWLARDLQLRQHVALKLFVHSKSMGSQVDDETNIYKRMAKGSKKHPGYTAVRALLDSFDLDGPDGTHRCLVHRPLFESVRDLLHRNPVRRLPSPVLAFILEQLFLALDFLHSECQIVHTDIKANNIMLNIEDDSVLTDFETKELQDPCPRKELDGRRIIYTSRELKKPKKWGAPILCDFGSAVSGDKENWDKIQPDVYRSPEVILEAPWTYQTDIWNVGCMVWDIFEGGHLFFGQDPEQEVYSSRAHLAEMISLLGPPPPNLLSRGKLSGKFFSNKGEFCAGIPIPKASPIENRETTLSREERERFLRLMRKMLQWDPEKRLPAGELAKDEWIAEHTRR